MYPTVAQKTEVGIVPSRPAGLSFVSDAQRLEKVDMLVGRGHAERLLISMDICTKHRLHKYGGHGYDHILENIVPWMRRRGTPEATLDVADKELPGFGELMRQISLQYVPTAILSRQVGAIRGAATTTTSRSVSTASTTTRRRTSFR